MKIQKAELARKLNKIKGVVPKRTTMPVLQGILLMDGYLIANNMEMAVKVKIEDTGGETFIIPERAFDLINNLPAGEIEIALTGKDTITIKADKIKNTYQTMDATTYPIAEMPADGSRFAIEADTLLGSMRKVAYAVPAQANSAVMSSMCLRAESGKLNFVGLDGHVVAWDKVDYDGEFELLIPKNTVDKLKSIGLAGEVQIKHDKSAAMFSTDEFEVYTRLVEGEYFKYQTLFKELPTHTVVSRVELLDAMTRAKMCTEEKCPVRFNIQDKNLNLSIKDKTTDYQETVNLQDAFPDSLEIGFDARLVLETLKAFDCENVGISFEGSKMPMIVEAEDSNFRTIVLPVTIR